MRVALDCMGGDRGPVTTITGALEAASLNPELIIVLVGDQETIHSILAKHKRSYRPQQIEVVHASDEITMDDSPAQAARQKKKSSMHVANQLVKDGQADAVFTAGNTGAAMGVSLLTLGRIPGIIRPALMVNIPSLTRHGWSSVLDVGANVDCKPKMLAQFAVMGDLYHRNLLNVPSPRVGLLSLGEEDSKGNELIRETHEILRGLKHIHFIGNVEGQDLVNGRADVVVCDGFVGNVILKFGEGIMRLFGDILKREVLNGNLFTKLTVGLLTPTIRRIYRRMDYKEYGSAPLLGVNGISTIGHGKSNSKAIKSAILHAARYVSAHINDKIELALRENGVAEL
ncbi:MAG: phosphate acyltransferase PlsX [candidate division FCPU426 bacterium]